MYSASGNIAPSPAPRLDPHGVSGADSRRTTGGVSATRRSKGPRSRNDADVHAAATGEYTPQQLRPHRVHAAPRSHQNRAHEREAKGVVLLAGMPQPRAVERERVDIFQRPRLKLLPVVALIDDQPSTSPANSVATRSGCPGANTSSATLPSISR